MTEHKQQVIQVFRVRLDDVGPDGVRGNEDYRLIAQQGIFNP